MLKSTLWWWLAAVIIFLWFGSQTTTSASAPTLTIPFRGYMLKIWAALDEVFSTNWFSLSNPAFTPFVQTRDILSSSPLTPLGILAKLSWPILLVSVQKVQLSVPTTSMTPELRYFMIWVLTLGSGFNEGDMTYLAAKSQSLSKSLEPSVPMVAAKVYP